MIGGAGAHIFTIPVARYKCRYCTQFLIRQGADTGYCPIKNEKDICPDSIACFLIGEYYIEEQNVSCRKPQ